LVGYCEAVSISNSYATGIVSGTYFVGGLVGFNFDNSESSISNSYATGRVSGSIWVGGLVGWNGKHIPISHSYWDVETSGQTRSDGGIGKTTAEMKKEATFVSWDFVNIWGIKEDITYPYLQWESLIQQTQNLISDVEDLELPDGLEKSLISKLDGAISALEKGQDNAAINKLNAFINEVDAQRGKKITEEQADDLIAEAQRIINRI